MAAETPTASAARAVEALIEWAATAPTPDAGAAHEALCAVDPAWADPDIAWQRAPRLVAEARRRKATSEADAVGENAACSAALSAAGAYFIAIRLYANFRRTAFHSSRRREQPRNVAS